MWLYFSENMTLNDETKMTELERTTTVQKKHYNRK